LFFARDMFTLSGVLYRPIAYFAFSYIL
jgi:hypothetical protein